jgi:DNA-directed RNA polymerase alpha subunit
MASSQVAKGVPPDRGGWSTTALRRRQRRGEGGPLGRDRAEGEEEMKSYDPDPNLPDYVSIDRVRFPPRVKRALVAAGLKTVGDVRKTSDTMLSSSQKLGNASLKRLRNELGRCAPELKVKK